MYVVSVINDGISTVIHAPGTSPVKIDSAKISKEVNKFDSFTFTIYPSNPGYNSINPFSTLVTVRNLKTNTLDFEGRVIAPAPSMDSSGLPCKEVTCEGLMGYLCDSTQPYTEENHYGGSASQSGLEEYLSLLLSRHNAATETYKHIALGNITLQTFDTSDGVTKAVSRGSTWDNINEKIIKSFGGEMQVRRGSDGLLYLDYAEQLGTTRNTRIEIAKNMVDASQEPDPSSVITRLYPYGAKITVEQEDPDTGEMTEVETEERIDITSVNGGLPYIDDAVAIDQYGIIEGYNEWDDITQPNNLLTRARQWLGENNKIPVSTSVTAYDLSLLGLDFDSFKLHDWYPCYNPLIGLDDELEIVKLKIDVNEPSNSSFDLGDTAYTLSQGVSDSNQQQNQIINEFMSQTNTNIVNINNRVTSTSASIQVMEDRITQNVTNSVETTFGEQIGDIQTGLAGAIVGVDVQYALGDSPTVAPKDGWSTTAPEWQAGKYMWQRTVTYYQNGSQESTAACIQGAQGEDGKGVTILGSYESYSDLVQAHPSGEAGDAYIVQGDLYVWDGDSWENVGQIQGPAGTDGVGISSSSVTYQTSTSGTEPPTGTWLSYIPTVASNQYLWTRTIINYTNGQYTTLYSVGGKGEQGDPGRGVENITEQYYLSTSSTSCTGGSWSNTQPTWVNGRYIWTRSQIEWDDGTTTYTTPVLAGALNAAAQQAYQAQQAAQAAQTTADKAAADALEAAGIANGKGDVLIQSTTPASTYRNGNTLWIDTTGGKNTPKRWDGSAWVAITDQAAIDAANQAAQAQQAADNAAQQAEESGDYLLGLLDDYQQTTNGQLGELGDQISNAQIAIDNAMAIITENTTNITQLTQTANMFDFNFQQLTTTVTQIGDQITTEVDERNKYIRFIDGEIWIGADPEPGEDDFKVVISNERIRFLQNNIEVAYISSQKMYITDAEVTNRFDLGQFTFVPRSNGNLTLRFNG